MNTVERILVPQPVSIREKREEPLVLRDGVAIEIPGDMGGWCGRRAMEFWHVAPAFEFHGYSEGIAPEGYQIQVTPSRVVVRASDSAGVRHAFFTLRQLSEPLRGVSQSRLWQLPAIEVDDWPSMRFRGILLVHYPESQPWELERNIRLAAFYKFNVVALEFRGTFPFEKHPELRFDDFHADRVELAHIVRLAKELGVTLVPLYNLLGHATGVGIDLGKHVILDRHPELAPLFEPDGWSLCLSNPNVRPLMRDAMEEMLDFFGNPTYFHAGSDEPFNLGTCSICRHADIPRLYRDYLLFLHDVAARRNCRMILWHDAFFDRASKDYEGYVVDDREGPDFHEILQDLPRDVIFDFWQYDYPEKDGEEPTWKPADWFQELGFDVLLSPWDNEAGIASMANKARNQNMLGMLQTTWFACRGTVRQKKLFLSSANNQWKTAPHPGKLGDEAVLLGGHLRLICQDMGLTGYRESGARDVMTFA